MNTNGTPLLTKDELRRSIRTALRAMPAGQGAEWSAKIRLRLKEEDAWVPQAGGTVALFGGMASEPDVLPLLPWLWDRGVLTAFFSIDGEVMTPRLIRGEGDLRPGMLGVLEPDVKLCEEVPVIELDTVLLPGMAFSPVNGARLGRGKGHYDRVLAALPEGRGCIGVCFHLQLHESVPLEAHDRHVQAVVTEQGWLRIAD
jgi:5-formyltetrahydrofolate cyclo-ligase